MRGKPIDLDKLHAFLFRRSDRFGRLRMSQRDFAKELGVAHETICRVMGKMAKQGRLKRIRSEKNNIGVYAIVDPAEWRRVQDLRGTDSDV
jgi:DNA-binding MarR family transcriptional regulator